ncbi:hypothetical protein [Ralstonia insidiosa]|jgi:hypothetical protein|nr:hypothetical protein [Ralstonia insidiosa]MBA9940575.1 hypothetical protein [Ralstonia insidiosa]MBC9968974.1 hypothetical protein [Ralstonia insidiosa]MBX3905057.1 hypothetical protein [Ralstonia insidiosa]
MNEDTILKDGTAELVLLRRMRVLTSIAWLLCALLWGVLIKFPPPISLRETEFLQEVGQCLTIAGAVLVAMMWLVVPKEPKVEAVALPRKWIAATIVKGLLVLIALLVLIQVFLR